MLPDRVSNPGPLTYESGALPTALRGPANCDLTVVWTSFPFFFIFQLLLPQTTDIWDQKVDCDISGLE